MLRENYEFFKEIYLELQYNSVYPFINKLELYNFCERSKMIDEKLNMSGCDVLNSSTFRQKEGIKAKTGLMRFELLEYIVRVANFKYV